MLYERQDEHLLSSEISQGAEQVSQTLLCKGARQAHSGAHQRGPRCGQKSCVNDDAHALNRVREITGVVISHKVRERKH